jgi:Gas vesicle synthesis protein GvpL/GvpF
VTDQLLWGYGVVPAQAAPSVHVAGVAGGAVDSVSEGELMLLVSPVPRDQFDAEPLRTNLNDLGWLERVAREHEAVLDDVLAAATVVPLRLCTIFGDADGARRMLEREHAALTDALERLEGRQEWGVKLLVEGERLAATAAPAGDQAQGEGGAAYLARRRHERSAREAARTLAAQLVDDVDGALRAHAVDAVRLRAQNRELSGHTGDMVLNGAYLVDADEVDALRATAAELQERHADYGALLVVTGPWPPYNFAARETATQPA